ncbi:LysE family transporter [Candidatus Micrarchaeota archaeon]|nr:LysE family transporter [Candidatus Micrarchaeota archaeon]MBU1682100.1 LysE family transporter [Candidatus Micrarchaeota archaeon]
MNIVIEGILLGLSISAPIGPTSIEIIRRSSKYGWKSAFIFFLGALTALIAYLVLAILGLSFLLQPGIISNALLFVGSIVLFYLAYSSYKDYIGTGRTYHFNEVENKQNFIPGMVLTISNPAVLVMWTGIMGAELATCSANIEQGLMISSGVLVGVCLFFCSLIAVVQKFREKLNKNTFKWIALVSAILLTYFAIKFGFEFIRILLGA